MSCRVACAEVPVVRDHTVWRQILHSLLRMDTAGVLPPESKFNRESDYYQHNWEDLRMSPRPGAVKGTAAYCAQDLLNQPAPRLFSTHMPPRMLPSSLERRGKVVYVLRNPKDAQISRWHMGKKWKRGPEAWDDSFESLVGRRPQVYGTMDEHLLATEAYINTHMGERAYVVTYEELTADIGGPPHTQTSFTVSAYTCCVCDRHCHQ